MFENPPRTDRAVQRLKEPERRRRPQAAALHPLLQLQATAGNAAVTRLIARISTPTTPERTRQEIWEADLAATKMKPTAVAAFAVHDAKRSAGDVARLWRETQAQVRGHGGRRVGPASATRR